VNGLPDEAFAAALAILPKMGPARLGALLERWSPPEAWARVREGRAAPEGAGDQRHAARALDVCDWWARHRALGVGVHLLGRPGYPPALAADHEPPPLLFHRGDLDTIEGARAAIVGTRKCTRYGDEVARELGRELARAGVRVVSGLALGIDAAAHHGALGVDGGAPPVGVVGSGLDVVYPRANRALWHEVARRGVLLSEAPLGAAPEGWRFPARNRIIAALGAVVVVVESHHKGGSKHTVDAAAARGRTVLAVPGPVRSSASAFTNELLAEGCPPARDVDDVLVALGLSVSQTGAPGAPDHRPPPDAFGARVLDALGWEAASLDALAVRTCETPAKVSVALHRLEHDGWVEVREGWWERVTGDSG
jgi:DNA processing protein